MSDGTEPTPYAPPASMLSEPVPDTERIASRGQRFANLLVDYVAFVFIGMIAGVAHGPVSLGYSILESTLISFSYYVVFEGLSGRTPGKLVTGTRVVAADGGPPSWGQILGRTLARSIPFEAISFLFGTPVVGWHDALSGTRVIRIR